MSTKASLHVARTARGAHALAIAIPLILILWLGSPPAGADSHELDDLRDYVAQVLARPASAQELTLPEMKKVPIPAPKIHRDPFAPLDLADTVPRQARMASPERNTGRSGELERFPTRSFRLVRTYSGDLEDYALIRAEDGEIFRARVGDAIGLHDGTIVAIDESSVTVRESPDVSGNALTLTLTITR